MIGHEDPGMNRDFIFSHCLIQPTSISSDIVVRGKTDLAVIATLDNVLRNRDWGESRSSCMHSSLSGSWLYPVIECSQIILFS